MIKNASNLYPFAIQDQLSNGLTGQTPSVYISKDGGSFVAATNSPSEFNASTAPGLYTIAFTATECDCDVMIIQVYLPHGQDPAILAVEEMQSASGGGATPQQIWEYAGGRTVTNTIPTAQNIWEYSSRTLTASALTAQQVWEYSGGRTLTASPTDISGLATSSDLSAVATNVSAIKAKTDNLPQTPAAVGSAMTLTSTAISAVQNGLATSSELSALETHGDSTWATATGFTTPSDLSGLSTFDPETDAVTINSTQAAGMATADLSGIPAAVWSNDSRTLTASALTAADVWSYSSRTLTASALTAQDVWEYAARTLTSSPTDISTLATKTDLTTAENAIIQAIPDVSGLSTFDPTTEKVTLNDTEDGTLSAIKTKVDTLHNTDLTGIATSKNVSDAQTAIIGAMPNDYAKAGDSMTLTAATVNSIKSGLATPETVWAYTSRSLTEEIAVSITTEDINNICAGVWSYVPRRLTSIVSDVIEPNKP